MLSRHAAASIVQIVPGESLTLRPMVLLMAATFFLMGCSQAEWGTIDTTAALSNSLAFSGGTSSGGDSIRKEPIRPLTAPLQLSKDKIALGHSLFNDSRLSGDNSISCATCHDVNNGGDDGQPTSMGINGRMGSLNAPTVLNSSLFIAQFWDGRARNLTEQAPGPIHNPVEMDSNWDEVIAKLSADKAFTSRFKKTYPQGITEEAIVDALVSYESALITVNSPFDRYLCGDDEAISSDALEGYKLFKSIGCISCHQGQAVGGNMFQEFGIMGDYFIQFDKTSDADKGRINVTSRGVDLHRFKVPSLRNVELTAPYFHNGNTSSLDEAIRVMAEYQLGESVTDESVGLIESFLHSLTGVVAEELR